MKQSPWFALSATILGLTIGYALVIADDAPSAYAGAVRCPYHDGGQPPA